MSAEDTRDRNKRDRLLLTVKREDDYPTIEAELTDADGETIDLSDPAISTIEVHADHLETGTAVINSTATVVDAPAGKVEYKLSATETAREGRHNLEFVIQYTDGRTRTVPQSGYYYLDVDQPVSRGQLDPGTVDGSTSISVGYLSADEATIGTLSVTNAPADANDAVRKAEHDTKADQTDLDSLSATVGTKADKDGAGTAALSNYSAVDADQINTIRYADDLIECQSIINEFGASGGVKIILPARTLTPAAADLPVVLQENTIVQGQGRKATTIDVTGVEETVFYASNSGVDYQGHRAEYLAFRDFSIVGDNASFFGTSTTPKGGIHLSNIRESVVERCELFGIEFGVKLEDGCFHSRLFNNQFRNSRGIGIHLLEGPETYKPNGTHIIGNSVSRNEIGARIEAGAGIGIRSYFDTNVESLLLEGVVGACVNGGGFENGGSNEAIRLGTSGGRTARGVVISGANFTITGGVDLAAGHGAINIVDANGVHVSGCRVYKTRDVAYGVKLSNLVTNVVVDSSNSFATDLDAWIAGSITRPQHLNDALWSTTVFKTLDEMGALADTMASASSWGRALTVLLTPGDVFASNENTIDGLLFPEGTHFTGAGNGGVLIRSDVGNAARLYEKQKLSNVTINSAKHAVLMNNNHAVLEDVEISNAGNDGVAMRGNNCVCRNVVCQSANIVGTDINMEISDGSRVVGCNGNVVSTNATNAGLAANVDTL